MFIFFHHNKLFIKSSGSKSIRALPAMTLIPSIPHEPLATRKCCVAISCQRRASNKRKSNAHTITRSNWAALPKNKRRKLLHLIALVMFPLLRGFVNLIFLITIAMFPLLRGTLFRHSLLVATSRFAAIFT